MSSVSIPKDGWAEPHLEVPESEIAKGTPVGRKHLINAINFSHFTDGIISAVYRHAVYRHTVALKVRPMPCDGADVFCRWTTPVGNGGDLAPYYLDHLIVTDDSHRLWIQPERAACSADGLQIRLPETGVQLAPLSRCLNPRINATVYQNGVSFAGHLREYTVAAFTVDIEFARSGSADWLRPDGSVYLVLADEQDTYYSGTCRIDGVHSSGRLRQLTLSATPDDGGRFRSKIHRSKRVRLRPAPEARFRNPLTLQEYSVTLEDLSGSGFSMVMDPGLEGLFVGLVIPGIRLEVAGEYLAQCKGQVVNAWCTVGKGAAPLTCFGVAILDIDVHEHMKLQKLVQQVENPHACMSGHVDLNALWRFFFKSGFIYPEKYSDLAERKQQIRQCYDTLYLNPPSFARHFVYQKNGAILGHGAMLRTYANAWMIHHHAALLTYSTRAGLSILDQVGQFINESHKLASMHMEYIFLFYRPDNKFPRRVFGEAARYAADLAKSSLDEFAYGHYDRPSEDDRRLPEGWSFADAGVEDLWILKAFYESVSGGLMTQAFDLLPDSDDLAQLSEDYGRAGFTRWRRLFVLKKENRLKAVFEVNRSDNGMNMSDLMNCIRIFLTDTAGVHTEILAAVLTRLSDYFDSKSIAVMAYPSSAAPLLPMPAERRYVLWIMNLQHSDTYFSFMHRLARFMGARA